MMETLHNEDGTQTLTKALQESGLTGEETQYLICVVPHEGEHMVIGASGSVGDQLGMLMALTETFRHFYGGSEGGTQ
jgi:hypothetical protein